jgi:hypothetical protein
MVRVAQAPVGAGQGALVPGDVPRLIEQAADVLVEALDGLAHRGRWEFEPADEGGASQLRAGVGPGRAVADVRLGAGAGPYLQAVGPVVGAALADWLRAAAGREAEHLAESVAADHQLDMPQEGDEAHGALVVAQAILRAVAGRRG